MEGRDRVDSSRVGRLWRGPNGWLAKVKKMQMPLRPWVNFATHSGQDWHEAIVFYYHLSLRTACFRCKYAADAALLWRYLFVNSLLICVFIIECLVRQANTSAHIVFPSFVKRRASMPHELGNQELECSFKRKKEKGNMYMYNMAENVYIYMVILTSAS